MPNLRIIYPNLLTSSSTVEGSNDIGPANKLLTDTKSSVWRTNNTFVSSQEIGVDLGYAIQVPLGTVLGAVLVNTNFSSAATIRLRCFNNSGKSLATNGVILDGGSQALVETGGYDSGAILAAPYQNLGINNWSDDVFLPAASTSTEYKNRKVYARVFLPPLTVSRNVRYIQITVTDTANINTYLEASRLIVGPVWSPKYNTSYGLSAGVKDLSTSVRTEAGDLITSVGIQVNTLNFDLKYLSTEDRITFNKIAKLAGMSKPIFVSLFPDNTTDWEKEQVYQLYGKFTQMPGLEHSVLDMYSAQVELEEV